MKSPNDVTDNTRKRILATAEKLFAQKGYNGVSVREITQSAKCNLAAVNYHFGNKKNLYFDVFRYQLLPRLAEIETRFEDNLAKQTEINLETIVRTLTLVFIEKHLNNLGNESLNSMMHREINNPTGAVEIVIKEGMVPFFEVLIKQLKPYLPENMDEIKIKLNIFSMIAMSLYFSLAQLPVTTITGKEYNETFINQLTEHIVSFALHGLYGKSGEIC
ncbi:MAG: TetR/AcrR family transcriptional regulator [Pseudomonadota bacterium]